MQKVIKNKVVPTGIVYRQAFSGQKLKELLEWRFGLSFEVCVDKNGIISFPALCAMAFEYGISKEEFKKLLDKSAKKMFADNFIWRFLKKHFGLDLVIPFITGYYTTAPIRGNIITNAGHAAYAGQISGVTSTAFTAMAYGTGTNAASATDTALQTETARAASTISRVTTSVTNDTFQSQHTFTAGGSQAITEEGLLDNNVSGGNLLAHQVFSAVNMVLNDTIQFTHKIQS